MSKTFISILFCFIFIMPIRSYAQMSYSLRGGVSIPQGEYASKSTIGEKSGYAKIGYCVMAEGSKGIGGNLSWVSSVAFSFNKIDETELQTSFGSPIVSSGSYVTTWAMSGIGFEGMISSGYKLYGISQIGLLLSMVPDLTTPGGGLSVTQTTSLGTAFAFAFGGGVTFNCFDLGIRYFSGEPEYEISFNGIKSKAVKPTSVLQFTIGVSL